MRISDWISYVCPSELAVDREVIFAREIEIALVVRRTAEDRTGAIVHQHIVDDPDRQMPVGIERMFDRKAGVEAQLLRGFQLLRRRALTAAFGDEGREHGRILRQPLGERMVGRDRREARAVKRVGPRREYVEARRDRKSARLN